MSAIFIKKHPLGVSHPTAIPQQVVGEPIAVVIWSWNKAA